MTERKRKVFYWLFKILSIIISCALPIWAICEKFPLWTATYGKNHSIGVGSIIAIIVIIVIFRKAVFNFIKDKLKITHAPPMVIWIVLIALSYILLYLSQFILDLVVVFWMGFIGCVIGTALTFVAERIFGKKESEDGKN